MAKKSIYGTRTGLLTTLKIILKSIICLCRSVCGYVHKNANAWWALKRSLSSVELELKMVVSSPMWVLGMNLGLLQDQFMLHLSTSLGTCANIYIHRNHFSFSYFFYLQDFSFQGFPSLIWLDPKNTHQ